MTKWIENAKGAAEPTVASKTEDFTIISAVDAPRRWTKPAAEILAKITRAREALTHQASSAPDH